MRTFTRYTLYQVPGWVVAGLVLYALKTWFNLPGWIALAAFAVFVAKDFLLYPFLRHAYEPHFNPGRLELIGEHGAAVEDLSPRGFVRVRGELWPAEVARGAAPVAAEARIRVQGVRGDTLLVMADPD